jgi:hypothetical protein
VVADVNRIREKYGFTCSYHREIKREFEPRLGSQIQMGM